MALSDEEKAARKAARRSATERNHERIAEREAARLRYEAAARFNKRSTRDSVAGSVEAAALTREEYEAAIERRLVGPVPEPHLREPLDLQRALELTGSDALTEWTKRSATSHGHTDNVNHIAPDSYKPTADELREQRAEIERQERYWSDEPDDDPDLTDDERAWVDREDDRYDEMAWRADVDDDDEPASWEIETSSTLGLYEEFQTPYE